MSSRPRSRKVPTVAVLIGLFAMILLLDVGRLYLSGGFERSEIEVEILYSSEKAGWLEAVTPLFIEEWEQNNSQSLKLSIYPIGSGKGTLQILKGSTKPVVWSPASRFWLTVLNHNWLKDHDDEVVNSQDPSLVVSPTVIATWDSYQEENNITGIQSLHELAVSDPEFTFAHTNPQSSNSGFGAVIMEAAVAAGKDPEELVMADLTDPAVHQWMSELESSAVQYGASTGFLGKMMASRGPDALKAAIVYENVVIERNKQMGDQWGDDSLVAVYPEEGTVMNDHPFSIINADWVSAEQRVVANDYLRFLTRDDIQLEAIESGFRTIKPISPEVESDAFRSELGVRNNLTGVRIYEIDSIEGEILERIPDLWLATRAFGDSNEEGAGISTWDVVWTTTEIVTGVLMVLIIIQTVRQRAIRKTRRFGF